ncbi:MAG: hypothetical protein CMI18_04840 [Opitutaceae bacterium]|nr:hypothetical protein [Opitutaceae bacterium]
MLQEEAISNPQLWRFWISLINKPIKVTQQERVKNPVKFFTFFIHMNDSTRFPLPIFGKRLFEIWLPHSRLHNL